MSTIGLHSVALPEDYGRKAKTRRFTRGATVVSSVINGTRFVNALPAENSEKPSIKGQPEQVDVRM